MKHRASVRIAAVVSLALVAAIAPARAATPDEACAAGHSPVRYWVGKALIQSFTPDQGSVARYDVKLFFRRAFSGRITSEVVAHLPTETVSDPFVLAGPPLASSSALVSAAAGSTRWVGFRLDAPVPVLPAGAPTVAIQLTTSSSNPAWGWTLCKTSYARGRGFARPDPVVAGRTVPNDLLNVDGGADLQFRAYPG